MALLDVTTGLPQMARGPTLLGMPLKQVSLITVCRTSVLARLCDGRPLSSGRTSKPSPTAILNGILTLTRWLVDVAKFGRHSHCASITNNAP